jgi:hypothetical protein
LSSIDNTTCDIGALEFTFTGYSSLNTTGGPTWTDSNFSFTPTANGFTLTFDGGSQSFTVPGAIENDEFNLVYTVSDLGGNITGETVTGGIVSASGGGEALYQGLTCEPNCNVQTSVVYEEVSSSNGDQVAAGTPFSSGSGEALDFDLYASYGGNAYWDGSATTYTFSTDNPPVTPEPASVILFGTGLLAIMGIVNRRKRLA